MKRKEYMGNHSPILILIVIIFESNVPEMRVNSGVE